MVCFKLWKTAKAVLERGPLSRSATAPPAKLRERQVDYPAPPAKLTECEGNYTAPSALLGELPGGLRGTLALLLERRHFDFNLHQIINQSSHHHGGSGTDLAEPLFDNGLAHFKIGTVRQQIMDANHVSY
jgi:hypothetical protein